MNNGYILMLAFLLDMLAGDPRRMPHIVVAIGKTIALLERALRPLFPATPRGELVGGGVLAALVPALSVGVPCLVLALSEQQNHLLRLALECFILYQLLATKSLSDAAGRVHAALARGDLPAARAAVGMIVGRDTAGLDAAGVARAAVETVAENASDGVVAPMFYFTVGGLPAALAYKAVNTMDSMIGYRNEKYLFFGRAAARLDDIANFVPARLTACLMILAAVPGKLDWRGAIRICRRDRRAHSSPNSGYPESACAGALGIRLGGDSYYGGRLVRKPVIGDAAREIGPMDIARANRLLYVSAVLALFFCSGGIIAIRNLS